MNELLLRRRNASESSVTSSPYDSRIEYLESTGTQYIDTLFKPDKDTRMEVVYLYKKNGTILPFGVRDSGNASDAKNGIFRSLGSANRCAFGNGSGTNVYISGGNSRNTIYDIYFDKNEIYVDGKHAKTIPYTDWQSNYSIYLFGVSTAGTFGYSSNVVIYSCKIWDDNTLVRDFIPVRVGSVGYMYDKTSKTLFGNVGSDDFILGNDVN